MKVTEIPIRTDLSRLEIMNINMDLKAKRIVTDHMASVRLAIGGVCFDFLVFE